MNKGIICNLMPNLKVIIMIEHLKEKRKNILAWFYIYNNNNNKIEKWIVIKEIIINLETKIYIKVLTKWIYFFF